jgi:transcriptional regulator with XRE-family HTH domain
MPNRHSAQKWGDWLDRRARHLGIKRHATLAAKVGCSHDQLARWMQMESPPSRMQKGFDESLAAALNVTPRTLFTDYQNVAPEDAPTLDPTCGSGTSADALKRQVHAVVELLHGDGLRELPDRGRALLRREMATSAA